MPNKQRIWTIVLLSLVFFTVLGSLLCILHRADHDCAAEECPVCTAIAACRDILKTLGEAAAFALFALFFLLAAFAARESAAFSAVFRTPVSLKVKMTD